MISLFKPFPKLANKKTKMEIEYCALFVLTLAQICSHVKAVSKQGLLYYWNQNSLLV